MTPRHIMAPPVPAPPPLIAPPVPKPPPLIAPPVPAPPPLIAPPVPALPPLIAPPFPALPPFIAPPVPAPPPLPRVPAPPSQGSMCSCTSPGIAWCCPCFAGCLGALPSGAACPTTIQCSSTSCGLVSAPLLILPVPVPRTDPGLPLQSLRPHQPQLTSRRPTTPRGPDSCGTSTRSCFWEGSGQSSGPTPGWAW